ncbi:hypothetical protein OTU49_002763, partial [Cherax quadricarinatus]
AAVQSLLEGSELPQLKEINLSKIFLKMLAKTPNKYHNISLYSILTNEETWKDDQLVSTLQDRTINGLHTSKCRTPEGKMPGVPDVFPYPTFIHLEPETHQCDSAGGGGDGGAP